MTDKYMPFKKLILEANRIVLTTHTMPDGDGIGSQSALCMALKQLGKKAICVNEDPLPERYRYLDPQNNIISCDEFAALPQEPIDLFIVVDTNNQSRIGIKMSDLLRKASVTFFVDHHPCHPAQSAHNLIDNHAAATGELVGHLIETLGIPFTAEMALALYTAILIDTSSFRYPGVTGDTHRLLGKLLDTGIVPSKAFNLINGTKQISHMRLLGAVLSSSQATPDKKIAWITVTHELMKRYDADPEDIHSFVNHLLILENIKVACMFCDFGDEVKISMRSMGGVDVGVTAASLGGGGHDHSAAAVVKGRLDDIIKLTVSKLQLMMKYSNP